MGQRYEDLSKIQQNSYAEGCPVLIEAYALLKDTKDGRVLAQVKLRNISEYIVLGCKVDVCSYEINGKETDGVKGFSYLDINAKRGDSFGTKVPIYLPKNDARKICVSVTEVTCEGGVIWKEKQSEWKTIEKQKTIKEFFGDDELVEQYKLEIGDGNYIPVETNGLFLCTCGTANKIGLKCCTCGRDYREIASKIDEDYLKKEAAIRIENEKKEQEQQKKKEEILKSAKKRRVIVTSIILLFALVGIVLYVLLYPAKKYKDAIALYEANKYSEAEAIVDSENWYFFDPDKLIVLKAQCRAGEGDYITAIEEIKQVDNAEEAYAQIILNYARTYADKGDYATALEMIKDLGDVNNERAEFTVGYIYTLINDNRFEAAKAELSNNPELADTNDLFCEINYQQGLFELSKDNYETAISCFEKCGEYKDSQDLLREARGESDDQNDQIANDELFEEIQKEMFLAHFDRVVELISELPQSYVDENPNVKRFIDIWPDAPKQYVGHWYTCLDGKRCDYGWYFGLVYNEQKIYYIRTLFSREDTVEKQVESGGMDWLRNSYMEWTLIGENELVEYALNDSTKVLEKMVLLDDGQTMESYNVPYGEDELELYHIYVR